MHRTGQSHIKEPKVLCLLLHFCRFGMVLPIVRTKVKGQAVIILMIVKSNRPTPPASAVNISIPGKGAEDNRILQPLAAVDGDDFHPLFVTLKSELLFVRPPAVKLPRLLKPFHKTGHSKLMFNLDLLQEFSRVQDICESPLAVGKCKQSFVDAFPGHKKTKHPHKPFCLPDRVILPNTLQPGLPFTVIFNNRMQPISGKPEKMS